MFEISNILSIFATAISIIALYYTRKQISLQIDNDIKNSILEYLELKNKLAVKSSELKSLRSQTGAEYSSDEIELFNEINQLIIASENLVEPLNKIMVSNDIILDRSLQTKIKLISTMIKHYIDNFDRFISRFQKFKDDKIIELTRRIEEIKSSNK